MSELLPCPFCKAPARTQQDLDWQFYVACDTDRCPGSRDQATWSAAKPRVAEADWNRRALPPSSEPAKPLVEQLEALAAKWEAAAQACIHKSDKYGVSKAYAETIRLLEGQHAAYLECATELRRVLKGEQP